MSLVQVRDVPDGTVEALKVQAAREGLSLSAYLRREFERLAAQPTNAEVAERLARRQRTGGPTTAETVAEVRRLRDES